MSLGQLLQDKRITWAKLRAESLELDGDLSVGNDFIVLGGTNIEDLTVQNVTVEQVLDFGVGGLVDGDVDFSGKITSVGGFEVTGQDTLEDNLRIVHPMEISSSVLVDDEIINVFLSRVGRSVIMHVPPQNFDALELVDGQVGQMITTVAGRLPVEFRPEVETSSIISTNTSEATGIPTNRRIGLVEVATTGQVTISQSATGSPNWVIPAIGKQDCGWELGFNLCWTIA